MELVQNLIVDLKMFIILSPWQLYPYYVKQLSIVTADNSRL